MRLLTSSAIASAACLPLLVHAGTKPIVFKGKEVKNFLAFGDSYTFVQGTQGHWGYSFISDALNYTFTPAQLLANEIVKNVTSSGGPNWVEYLTGCFEGLPARCPGTKLWDFAFAGADISAQLLNLHHNYTIDLDDQVKQWDLYARDTIRIKPKDTLVAFWIGINDINDSANFNNITSFPAWYDTLVTKWFESVDLVYNRGYRNFLFMLLPPLDRTPSKLVNPGQRPNITMVNQWNTVVRSHVAAFQEAHADFQPYVFDTHSALTHVLDDPGAYGIRNITNFCPAFAQPDILWNYASYGCQPISEYFWLNSGHISFTAHKILASKLKEEIAAP